MRIVSIRHLVFITVSIWAFWSTNLLARAHIDPVDEITQELYKKSEKTPVKKQKPSPSRQQKRALPKKTHTIALKGENASAKNDPLQKIALSKEKRETKAPDRKIKDDDLKKKDEVPEDDTSSEKKPSESPEDILQKTSVTTVKNAPQSLPLPRFVSIKATAAHLHVGPGDHYPIEWRYVRQFLPVEVLLEFDHWRQIRDSQGTIGWVHKTLLSSRRFAMVQTKVANLHKQSNGESPVVATVEPGVIVKLVECTNTMCHVDIQGIRGWISRDLLFGLYPDESHF